MKKIPNRSNSSIEEYFRHFKTQPIQGLNQRYITCQKISTKTKENLTWLKQEVIIH